MGVRRLIWGPFARARNYVKIEKRSLPKIRLAFISCTQYCDELCVGATIAWVRINFKGPPGPLGQCTMYSLNPLSQALVIVVSFCPRNLLVANLVNLARLLLVQNYGNSFSCPMYRVNVRLTFTYILFICCIVLTFE